MDGLFREKNCYWQASNSERFLDNNIMQSIYQKRYLGRKKIIKHDCCLYSNFIFITCLRCEKLRLFPFHWVYFYQASFCHENDTFTDSFLCCGLLPDYNQFCGRILWTWSSLWVSVSCKYRFAIIINLMVHQLRFNISGYQI